MGEATYERLRKEWQEKLRNLEIAFSELENRLSSTWMIVDAALALLAKTPYLYPRLDKKQQSTLLQVLAKRNIGDSDGEIKDHELNSPFVYLRSLVDDHNTRTVGSEQVREGVHSRSRMAAFFM